MQRSPSCFYCELKLSAYSFQGGSRRTGRGESGVTAGQRNHHWVSRPSTGSARARARRGRERTFGSRFKVLGRIRAHRELRHMRHAGCSERW
jgi:hypothetical protein